MKSVSGEALRSGAEILSELETGAPIKDILIKQRDKTIRNLASKASEKLKSMNQSGKGFLAYKRKRVASDSLSPPPKRRRATSRKRKVVKRKKKVVKRKKGKRKSAKKKPVKRKTTKRRKKRSTKKVVFDKDSFLNKFTN